jgi:hypothetical protein
MRQLYFDIDGTLLRLGTGVPKPALEHGAFEAAIRQAQIDSLVCVGNFCHVVELVKGFDSDYDAVGIVFSLCKGVFTDEQWFRRVTTLIADPEHRVAAIDTSGDWWYVDDLAERFCDQAGLQGLFRRQLGHRICTPQPDGTGDDVLRWAASIPKLTGEGDVLPH